MAANAPALAPREAVARIASRLAGGASLEIGSLDRAELDAALGQLRPGQRIYVSHLPGQTWKLTCEICARLSGDGFDPVPHIPVRLLDDAHALNQVLRAARESGVREPLLISGDYAAPRGAFSSVLEVLRTDALRAHGFERVSLAGHPEGHPRVPWDEICQAQVDKWRLASAQRLQVTFITQFFFAAGPFVQWARYLRAAGVDARLVAGLAGPTGLGRLIKLAGRCGIGASLRTLTSRPAAISRLFADHDPGELLLDLAAEKLRQDGLLDGLHLFSLGGFLRTASWWRQYRPGSPE
jgi:methylenetetrahydrofolate reductase (NADPH)